MRTQRKSKRASTLILALLLLFTVSAVQAQTAPGINSTYQFFNSANFAHLTDKNPVFKTMSYYELLTLFDSDGTYMILFGGSWCGNTQAVISQINDVAKEYGVKTIYNFDWKLDGASLHVRDTKNAYANLYVDVVNKYLPNIVTLYEKDKNNVSYKDKDGKDVVANKLQVPFLFIYNRNNKDAKGQSAPIVASYEKMLTWEKDFQTNGVDDPAKIEAYRKEIRPLFDFISTTSGGKKVAKLDYLDNFALYSAAYNKTAGLAILDEKDKPFVLKTVSFIELTKILESPGNFVFMFGGPWCPNTRAVIKLVNQYAKKYNIDTVYTFDNKLDSNVLHIRDTKNPYASLYVDMVRKYFPGIVTEYAIDKNNVTYTDKDFKFVSANKLQVPYVFVYNKDWKDAQGNPKPILDQVELMYTWKDIQPDYKDEKGAVGSNYKTYTAALDKLFAAFQAKVKK
jgi:thiol-disulfide isomerase/thioredoxin